MQIHAEEDVTSEDAVLARDGQPAKVPVGDLLPDGPRSWFAKD